MPVTTPQLALGIGLEDNATFGNFFPARNELILQTLQTDSEQTLFLCGPAGSGKTHLLQAVCHAVAARGESPAYLPLSSHAQLAPAMLEGLEQQSVVLLDDIQHIVGQSKWEIALFHLYNRIRDCGTRLLVSSLVAPAGLALDLPDLASRLSWGAVFQLQALNDEEKCRALQLRAQNRGMPLSDEVAGFLLKRAPRDMDSLFNLLNQLDQVSLAAQRRLTIPFVRQLLGS